MRSGITPSSPRGSAMPDPLIIARSGDVELALLPALANRHGLITGATGTGKTVTLQVLAERISSIGVPVFMADVKGDLAGMSQPGAISPKFAERLKLLGIDAPKVLLDRIEQVVRLVRSKGVGVFFVTQNPLDVPDIVLGQLGNRVQHALRAFTPRDQKAVKTAAETMRANPKFSTEKAITELGVGEALISFLDEKGRPNVVERAFVLPPASRIGPITTEERNAVIAASSLRGTYDKSIDRESAYEKLKGRATTSADAATAGGATAGGGVWDSIKGSMGGLMT